MLDVNLNGQNNYFSLSQVGFVYYYGQSGTGPQTFTDTTRVHVVAYGGSVRTPSTGEPARTPFMGGAGRTRSTRAPGPIS